MNTHFYICFESENIHSQRISNVYRNIHVCLYTTVYICVYIYVHIIVIRIYIYALFRFLPRGFQTQNMASTLLVFASAETDLLMLLMALGVVQLLFKFWKGIMVSAQCSAAPPATTTDEPSGSIGATGSAPSGSIGDLAGLTLAVAEGELVARLCGEHRTKKFVGVTEVNTVRGAGNRVRHFEKKLAANAQSRALTQSKSQKHVYIYINSHVCLYIYIFLKIYVYMRIV